MIKLNAEFLNRHVTGLTKEQRILSAVKKETVKVATDSDIAKNSDAIASTCIPNQLYEI